MTPKLNSVSVVSPVYKAEACIVELYTRLVLSLESITEDFEIVLVNDSSPDNCWTLIEEICKKDQRVVGVDLSRNFGQHCAIIAGLSVTTKNWIIVMDCDLQDTPEEISKLAVKAQEGYEVIFAKRINRQDSFFKKLSSKVFFFLLKFLSGQKQDSSIANFGIYNRKVIDAVLSSGDKIRSFPGIVRWVGFKVAKVDVKHSERFAGESSYNFRKMFFLAMDIVLAFTDKPIRLVIKLGLFISFLSTLYVTYIIWNALSGNYQILGYASIIASIWMLSGFIIFSLGVIGLYIGKTFEQTKGRPPFIISNLLNKKD